MATLAFVVPLASCAMGQSSSRVQTPGVDQPGATRTDERIPADGTPVDPERIGVLLDPSGRPYDVDDSWASSLDVRLEEVTTFAVPDGKIRVSAGEMVGIDTDPADPTVAFEGADRLTVSEIRVGEGASDPMDRIQGIRLDAPGREVVRWRSFEPAYGTDGGLGAVMTEAGHGRFGRVDGDAVLVALEEDDAVALRPGKGESDDIVVFANGYGDGGFPMSRGVDADGRTVSLVIWDTSFPWRVAMPTGTAPPDVTRIEEQYQECLDGERDLIAYTTTTYGTEDETVETVCAIEE